MSSPTLTWASRTSTRLSIAFLDVFEDHFCLFDQNLPIDGALASQIAATQPLSRGVTRSTR
jgi:hypothetical protein